MAFSVNHLKNKFYRLLTFSQVLLLSTTTLLLVNTSAEATDIIDIKYNLFFNTSVVNFKQIKSIIRLKAISVLQGIKSTRDRLKLDCFLKRKSLSKITAI